MSAPRMIVYQGQRYILHQAAFNKSETELLLRQTVGSNRYLFVARDNRLGWTALKSLIQQGLAKRAAEKPSVYGPPGMLYFLTAAGKQARDQLLAAQKQGGKELLAEIMAHPKIAALVAKFGLQLKPSSRSEGGFFSKTKATTPSPITEARMEKLLGPSRPVRSYSIDSGSGHVVGWEFPVKDGRILTIELSLFTSSVDRALYETSVRVNLATKGLDKFKAVRD